MSRADARVERPGAAEPILRVLHVLIGVACIETGSSVAGMIVPIRAGLEYFSIWAICLLGAVCYAGFAMGCLALPRHMHRIGHIRIFSGLAALAASALLNHPFAAGEPVWLELRLVIVFCFAGLFLAVESWLNARATTSDRGRIMAAYMIASWLAVIAGKLLFIPLGAGGVLPFAVVSITICLAVVAVAFSPSDAPPPGPAVRLRPVELFRIAPVGAAGCLASLAANGAFWSLALSMRSRTDSRAARRHLHGRARARR